MGKTSENRSTRPSLEEYIEEQLADAKELGNPTYMLFAWNEKALEKKLKEQNRKYITPRVGQYIVFV
jgi:hypothetical protein